MIDLVQIFVFLPLGFWLLTKGGSGLIAGSAELSRRFGLPPILVGLTIVAWATSAPELVASSLAAYQGNPGISIGNVLGSNVANIGLVLGASALVLPAILARPMGLREAFWVAAAVGALWWVCGDGRVTRTEACGLLGMFAIYNVQLVLTTRKNGSTGGEEDLETRTPVRDLILGCLAIVIGAKLVVTGAETGARQIGVSDRVIGLTLVAVGTSLPELAAGLSGAFRNHADISLGNVVGSNVFNATVVIGIVALIVPLDGRDPALGNALGSALALDFPIVMGFTLAAVLLPRLLRGRLGRLKALLLLGTYGLYSFLVFAG